MTADSIETSELRERTRRYLLKHVSDAHLAEDLAQDVMVKLHVHAARVPSDARRRTAWALRAARNAAVDWYRSPRRRVAPLDDAPETAAETETTADPSTELAGCLAPMLRHLPEPYRRAVELADLRELTGRAVADELGVSPSGAKSRVRRGRRQLRALLAECCSVETDRFGNVQSFEPTTRAREYCGAAGACAGGEREIPAPDGRAARLPR